MRTNNIHNYKLYIDCTLDFNYVFEKYKIYSGKS